MKIFYLFLNILIIGFFSTNPIPAQAKDFPDIKSPILHEAVNYLNEKGIIKGYDDGTFKPDQVINRAEALKIIFESKGIIVDDDTNSGFPDVHPSLWFAKYITYAKKLDLIKGYPDGTYKPEQMVNRAEFIKIAMAAQSYYEPPTSNQSALSQYQDLESAAWYVPYLNFAVENQFLEKGSKFYPTDGMTRGEAAKIIYQVTKKNEQLSGFTETIDLRYLGTHSSKLGDYSKRDSYTQKDFEEMEPAFGKRSAVYQNYVFFTGYEGYVAYYKMPNLTKSEGIIDIRIPGYRPGGSGNIYQIGKYGYLFNRAYPITDEYNGINWIYVIDLEQKKLVNNGPAKFNNPRLFGNFYEPDLIDDKAIYDISIYPDDHRITKIDSSLKQEILPLEIDYSNISDDLMKREYSNDDPVYTIEHYTFQHIETQDKDSVYITMIIGEPYRYLFKTIDKTNFKVTDSGSIPDLIGDVTDFQAHEEFLIFLTTRGIFMYNKDFVLQKNFFFKREKAVETDRFFIYKNKLFFFERKEYYGRDINDNFFINKIDLEELNEMKRSEEYFAFLDADTIKAKRFMSLKDNLLMIYSGYMDKTTGSDKESRGSTVVTIDLVEMKILENKFINKGVDYTYWTTTNVIPSLDKYYLFLSSESGPQKYVGITTSIFYKNINGSKMLIIPPSTAFKPYAIVCQSPLKYGCEEKMK